MERSCFCGCKTFRFNKPIDNLALNSNTCSNCQHLLAEHIAMIRSKQAD